MHGRKDAEEKEASRSMFRPVRPSPLDLLAQLISPRLPSRTKVAVHCKSPKREILAVPMVPEVEDARESRTSMANLFPGPIGGLVAKQILDASRDAKRIRDPGRHQRHQRPRGL